MSFISYLINGISLGSVYALIALGYTMVYGIATVSYTHLRSLMKVPALSLAVAQTMHWQITRTALTCSSSVMMM